LTLLEDLDRTVSASEPESVSGPLDVTDLAPYLETRQNLMFYLSKSTKPPREWEQRLLRSPEATEQFIVFFTAATGGAQRRPLRKIQSTTQAVEFLPPVNAVLRFLHRSESLRESEARADVRQRKIQAARNRHTGVRALADLQEWLGLSIAEVCRASGLAQSTVYHWADHSDTKPRMSTVRGLLALWALAGTVREVLGEGEGRAWWHSGDPSALELLLAHGPSSLDTLQERVATMAVGADRRPPRVPQRGVTAEEAQAAMQELLGEDQ
jgi:hypothetical protein